MALPNVSVQIQNGGLGKIASTDDRVVGLIVNGDAGQGLVPGQISQIFGKESFAGFAGATYPSFAAEYYRQMSEFYSVAGDGAEIWVLFANPTTPTATLFTNGQIASLIDAAGGRLNVIAISRYLPDYAAINVSEGIDPDILEAMDEAHALAVSYATLQQPLRFILDGRKFNGDTVGLRNLKGHTFNRVAINLATTRADSRCAAQGLLLGRIASAPVNRNIGRVKDGSVPISQGYLTSGVTVEVFGNKATAVNDKGYIFLRKFVGKAGYYWNDDHMVTADTDDYSSLANGRTIDKAARIAYTTFVDELLDEVQVDPTSGKIAVTTVKQYQAKIERAIGLSMAANGEISGVEAFIDPAQDILATSTLKVDLRIVPTGTNRTIVVKLGLTNPNAA